MKKKGIISFSLLTLLVTCLIVLSCSEEDDKLLQGLESVENFETADLNEDMILITRQFENTKLSYQAIRSNSIVNSRFTVTGTDDIVMYQTDYSVDPSAEHYKLYQADKLINMAEDIDSEIGLSDYSTINDNLHSFMQDILTRFQEDEESAILNSLYFHSAIVSIKKRSLENLEKCECTIHPGYMVDRIGFICQEDFLIPVETLKSFTADSEVFLTEEERSAFETHIALALQPGQGHLSFDKIYSFYVSETDFQNSIEVLRNGNGFTNTRCWLGKGSDHGCCGNYSGCCYYVNPICWIHDKICINCNGWWCLSGCIPDNFRSFTNLNIGNRSLYPIRITF